jgi:hypothetical protein
LNIREKITSRLDSLKVMMERQEHLSNPDFVSEKLQSITKFWSALSEEEREYVSAARMVSSQSLPWEIPRRKLN